MCEGTKDGTLDGFSLDTCVGNCDTLETVGFVDKDGLELGNNEGICEGDSDGMDDGFSDGPALVNFDGDILGNSLGKRDDTADGECDG